MASSDFTQKPSLTEADLDQIGNDISDVGTLIYSIRQLAVHHPQVDDATEAAAVAAGIQALCEKAGTIADRCAAKLGSGVVAGSFVAWARLGRPAAEAAAEAQVTA